MRDRITVVSAFLLFFVFNPALADNPSYGKPEAVGLSSERLANRALHASSYQ